MDGTGIKNEPPIYGVGRDKEEAIQRANSAFMHFYGRKLWRDTYGRPYALSRNDDPIYLTVSFDRNTKFWVVWLD